MWYIARLVVYGFIVYFAAYGLVTYMNKRKKSDEDR